MFGNPHFDKLRESFSDQFEADGSDFLYRRGAKGPGIRVTPAERDAFVALFDSRLRYATWAIVPAVILPIIGTACLSPRPDDTIAQLVIGGSVGLALILFLLAHRWASDAPSRALRARPRSSAALTREDVRRRLFAKTTYGRLAAVAAGAPLLLWKISLTNDVWRGWGLAWPVFAVTMIVAAIVMALRKWRFERKG